MHRHGAVINKLGRERDQRRALVKGLVSALIDNESIETTLPKAKAIIPITEKLITKAKKGGLHNRRQIISSVSTAQTAHKLVDDIAPKLSARTSGHLRLEKTGLRRGDNAMMARVSFVDDLTVDVKKVKKPAHDTTEKKTVKSTRAADTKKGSK